MKYALALAATLIALPGWAMDPTASSPGIPCPARMGLEIIAEPWEENSASYMDGELRVALLFLLDQHEYQLALLHGPRTELGTRQCHLIAPGEAMGFQDIDFASHQVANDPEKGLTITVPVLLERGETSDDDLWADFFIQIDPQTGDVRYQAFS